MICKKIKHIGPLQRNKTHVVSIYGVAGIVKTTICKTLGNELAYDYEERVCHVEFVNICKQESKLKRLLAESGDKAIAKIADKLDKCNARGSLLL